MDINTLPREADNYDAWCERCHKVHPYYTMTREKFEALMLAQAQSLADSIDADIAARASQGAAG